MHATGTDTAAGAAGHGEELGRQRFHVEDRLRPGLRPRVGGVEAVDVGGDEQGVGIHQRGHDRGEVVVVAQLELVDGDRVVLVDHRQRTERQQFLQRRARIEVATPVAQVVVGQQDLRDGPIKEPLPQCDQLRLPECGQRLPFGHRCAGLRLAVQQAASRRHRA